MICIWYSQEKIESHKSDKKNWRRIERKLNLMLKEFFTFVVVKIKKCCRLDLVELIGKNPENCNQN